MLAGLSLAVLLAIFAGSAAVIWFAGVKLADTTATLSSRFQLGEALGGVIVLAIATNLPEIAITVSAALSGELGVAVGNILGGIAIQTVVLVAMDVAMKEPVPLPYRAASLSLVIEALLVIAVLIVTIMATQLPNSLIAAINSGHRHNHGLVDGWRLANQPCEQKSALACRQRGRSQRQ